MRLLLISAAILLLCSCSSGKPQYIPPPNPVEPQPILPATPLAQEPEKVIEKLEPVAENSFLAILQKEGIPSENFVPRSKEQVAVYRQGDIVRFYYFKRNLLVGQHDYPAETVAELKASNRYPDTILREIGARE